MGQKTTFFECVTMCRPSVELYKMQVVCGCNAAGGCVHDWIGIAFDRWNVFCKVHFGGCFVF